MGMITLDDTTTIQQRYQQHGQEHVFRFWDQLDVSQKQALLEQAASIDLDEIDRLVSELVRNQTAATLDLDALEPAPWVALPENGGDATLWQRATALGEEALRSGRVAAFTVAGGQGTRLGFDGPKGTFPVTPVKHKPLFQVFAEKIKAASQRYGRTIPWLIMTSRQNHAATATFFEERDYFGLDAGQVHFFAQGLMPAVDFEGRLLMAAPGEIAMSPDGHGGSLRALVRSGAVDTMKRLGVDTISYFQVDNPLVRCIDPAFIGMHLLHESTLSSKMIPKAYPEEKVGHFCLYQQKTCVIEYSDMPDRLAAATGPDGKLRFSAGSIAIHLLDLGLVEKLGSGEDASVRLPFHRADKKVPTVDETGAPVIPAKPNGVKFEMFVFDAIPFAERPVVIETAREDDFSPVKNATGIDSPETAQADQMRQAVRWLKASGLPRDADATDLPAIPLEISPLFADSAERFVECWNALPSKPDPSTFNYLE